MKTKLFLTLLLALVASHLFYAQSSAKVNPTKYQIVFQLTSADTSLHRLTIRQINNALTEAPNSTVELVCHGAGITFLQTSKTLVADKIAELKNKGVSFAACENTIRDRNIDKADILPQAMFVPAGVIELADKQAKGWSYIKM